MSPHPHHVSDGAETAESAADRAYRGHRVAVVSGGGTGIGRAIAAELAQDGFEVVIVGRRGPVLEATADALNRDPAAGPVRWRAADLTDPDAVEALAAGLRGQYG